MSSIAGSSLSITGTSTLNGLSVSGSTAVGAIQASGSFSQSGTSTFSTGSGLVSLNGPTVTSSTVSVGTNLTVNGTSALVGITTVSGLLQANGGVNAGSATIITTGTVNCGTLIVGSGGETDTGILTVTGLLSANGGLTVNSTKTLTLPSNRAITSSNDVVDTSNPQTIAGVKTFSNQIIANSGIDTGGGSITCGSLTCSSETDTGALTVTGTLNANGGIVTNGANINAGAGTLQAGAIRSQVASGPYTGLNSYFFTNGDVYGTTYFDNPQASSSINFRIGASLPTFATINTNGLSVNGSITTNNVNSNSGTKLVLNSSNTSGILLSQSGGGVGIGRSSVANGYTLDVDGGAVNGAIITNNGAINAGSGTITCGAINNSGIITSTNYWSLNNTAKTNTNTIFLSNSSSGSGATSQFKLQQYDNGTGAGSMGTLFLSRTTANDLVILGSNGYVGINTTTPAYQLDVNGAINCTSITCRSETDTSVLTVTGALNANGGIVTNNGAINAGTGSITCGSINTNSILANNNCNVYFPSSLPTTSNNSGLGLLWNVTSGLIDTALLAYGQGGAVPGFTFYSVYMGANTRSLLATIGAGGSSFNTSLTVGQTLTANGGIQSNGDITLGNTNKIIFPNVNALNYIASGPSDGASSTSFDLKIGCWLGLGFVYSNSGAGANTSQTASIYFDCRNGVGNFGSINTYTGTTSTNSTATGTITSAGLITANGGITIPAGQSLTVNGTFSPSAITASGLITANGGLTIPSGQTLTVNGGLTMGANKNITLASTFTAPTSGQLGYTITGTNNVISLSSLVNNYWASLSLPVGTWLLKAKLSVGGSANILSCTYGVGTNYVTGNFNTADVIFQNTASGYGSFVCVANETFIINNTSSATYYFYRALQFTGTLSVYNDPSFTQTLFTATRIA